MPEPEVAWCRRHLEPFRRRWPRGYGLAILLIFQHVTADDRFYARFPRTDDGLVDASPRAMSRELAAISPLCCFLGDLVVAAVTREALSDGRRKDLS